MRTRENGVNTAFQITGEAADERVNTLNKRLLMQKGGLRTASLSPGLEMMTRLRVGTR